MPRAAGSQTPGYKAAKKVQDSFAAYVEKLLKIHPKAVDLMCDLIEDKEAMPQLRFGAAKRADEQYNRLYKELKDKLPKDFIVDSPHKTDKKKITGSKDKGNGLIDLEYKEEDTGT